MFTTRISKIVMVAVIIAVALLTASFAITPKTAESYPDYALRHPGGLAIPVTANLDTQGSDYFQRHPELTTPAILGLGASDYFQRHPELIAPAGTTVDMTDYYFRQKAIRSSARRVDLSDYYFRHINN